MRSCLRPAALVSLALLVPAAAHAQWDFGIRGGLYTEDSDPFAGIELLHPIGNSSWVLNPNLEAVFVGKGDLITVNGDVHYDLPTTGSTFVWAGGGLAVLFRDRDVRPRRFDGDSETDIGLNLLAGVGFSRGAAVRPYIQGKVILSDDTEAAIAVGLRF